MSLRARGCGVGPSQRARAEVSPSTAPNNSDTAIRPYLGMGVGMRALQGYGYSRQVFRQCICAMAKLIEDEILDA